MFITEKTIFLSSFLVWLTAQTLGAIRKTSSLVTLVGYNGTSFCTAAGILWLWTGLAFSANRSFFTASIVPSNKERSKMLSNVATDSSYNKPKTSFSLVFVL